MTQECVMFYISFVLHPSLLWEGMQRLIYCMGNAQSVPYQGGAKGGRLAQTGRRIPIARIHQHGRRMDCTAVTSTCNFACTQKTHCIFMMAAQLHFTPVFS